MRRLLITGFEPFGGEETNPSWDALALIPDRIADFNITKLEIPVVFGKSADVVIKKAEEIKADVVLCIGQAGGRDAVTPEMIGINLRYATIPDNDGNKPVDERIIPDAPDAYFTTLPARKMAAEIEKSGIRSKVSYSAGAYVCNEVIFSLMHHFKGSDVKVGFIHVPYSCEQEKDPAMPLKSIAVAIISAINAI